MTKKDLTLAFARAATSESGSRAGLPAATAKEEGAVRVHFCGVRGSTPVADSAFLRYGGSTSCVAVSADGEDPRLVLDAGTGLMRLSAMLGPRPFVGTILLSHLHWDHTHGMPFFAAGLRPGGHVRVLLPTDGRDPEELLARAFSPPHFPVRPRDLGGNWVFEELTPGWHQIEGYDVLVEQVPHKGGTTYGIRVERDRASLAYLPDHAPTSLGGGMDGLGERHDAALKLGANVDLLIHDAQHLAREFPMLAYLGHATVDYAMALADECDAGTLCLFHHAPSRTDDEIDEIVAEFGAERPVIAAAEGQSIDLDGAPARVVEVST
jgi:phosphoribosyl 1,2-cyclic phosphodiesterase